MNLLIFGATGSVGRQLTQQALQQNHSVTAFTRNAQKLADLSHPGLRVFSGDVADANAVEKAVAGHDCVYCTIGDGNKGTIRANGTQQIITAMRKANLKRLICQTTLGMGESRSNLNFFWKHIMFGLLLRKAYKDHQLQEQHVLDSRLDWTIVRPSAFTKGPVTGNYKVGFDGSLKDLNLKIARADVAHFMLQQASSNKYLHQAVSVSN